MLALAAYFLLDIEIKCSNSKSKDSKCSRNSESFINICSAVTESNIVTDSHVIFTAV